MKQVFPGARVDLLKHKRLYSLSGQQKGDRTKEIKKDWNWFKGRILAIPRRIKYEWNYVRKFHFSNQEFDFFDYDEDQFRKFADSYDLIVVGSDTILIELKRNGRFGLMWLLGVDTCKALFAASAAPANYTLSQSDVNVLKTSFSDFKLISVRDSVTFDLLSKKVGLGDRVVNLFDPTYLIPSSEFHIPYWIGRKLRSIARKRKIALVNFGNAFEKKKLVTQFVRSCGYYTIATHYNQWADMNLMSFSPFEWGAMYQYVDLTVTERFHDSVFSLRNNKPVVAVDWEPSRFALDGSSKLTNLLDMYGLMNLHYNCMKNDNESRLLEIIRNVNDEFNLDECRKVNDMIFSSYADLMTKMKFF